MNRSYFSFAFLCLVALCGTVLGHPAVGIVEGMGIAKEGLGIIKEGIDTLDKGFDLYNRYLEKFIPWDELNKTITKLDEYRSDYSDQAADLIGDIKTKMMDGGDAYFRATESVYKWCSLAIKQLGRYKILFNGKVNEGTFNAARKILLQVLEDGLQKMTKGQQELADSSSSFNIAAGKLKKLNFQLATDFDESSEYFETQKTKIRAVGYGAAAPFMLLGLSIAAGVIEGKLIPELKAKMEGIEKFYNKVTVDVEDSLKNCEGTKAKLEEEIHHIGEVEVQTLDTKYSVELDDTPELKEAILESVENLITECQKYRTRHIDNHQSYKSQDQQQ